MTVRQMIPCDAPMPEEMQHIVFPTLAFSERLRAAHYLAHLQLFVEGQFVLTNEAGEIIGMTTTQRYDPDPSDFQHTFSETSGSGWMTRQQPDGLWLYGLDMGIHPDWQGRGGARLLYRARQQLVRRLGLRGQLTVGMMNGYGTVAAELSGEDYYRQWLEGHRNDPTMTRQRKIGFQPLGLIPDYLHDPACGNYGVMLRMDAGVDV